MGINISINRKTMQITEIITPDEPLTVEEIRQFQIDEIKNELRLLDDVMPRYAEDIIIATGSYNNLPQIAKDRYNRKQLLRQQLQNL